VKRPLLFVLLSCVSGSLFAAAKVPAAEADRASEILDRAESRFRSITDYECVIDYDCRLPDRAESKTFRVWYRQPNLLRVRVLRGPNKGSEVALDENGRYRGRKGGLLRPIVVSLKPTDKRLQGIRGKSITEFNVGTIYQRCRARASQGSAELQVARTAEEPGTKGVVLSYAENGRRVQETYRFDPSTWFLSSCTVVENGNLIESFDVQQLKVNSGLDENWFRL
jgi:outer membrane lipoprotein-sorting protein